jgi:hypothetical protein
MLNAMRLSLFAFGAVCLALTIGFGWQMDWAVHLWPWEESRLSYIFLASITAAIAAPSVLVAVTEEYAALIPQSVTTLVQGGGVAGTCLVLFVDDPSGGKLGLAVVAAGSVVLAIGTLWQLRSYAARDLRPLPEPVRWSFAAFSIVLVIVGTMLIFGRDVFPWPLETGTSAVYGWIFLGASAYFLYATLKPRWYAACGPLWGFLAYDVVLIVPFLRHFENIDSDHRTSLVIYVTAIVYSGLLAIYYLFVSPATRLTRPELGAARIESG